jgi:hypothetical protein
LGATTIKKTRENKSLFIYLPVLKFPTQCPIILLVEVRLREALGSEKVKFQEVILVLTRGQKVS